MIVKVNGNVKPYYVQTIAMIFFPGAKFPENEELTPETVVLTLDMTETDTGVHSAVTIAQGETSVSAEADAAWTKSDDRDHVRKLSSGEALLNAGAKFTGYTPPWGILTGVRPAKVASELFEHGFTPDEAAAVIAEEYFVTEKKAKLAVAVAASEAKLANDAARRECSVYVGIPFCPTRCAYCSFVSYTSPNLLKLIPDYLVALARDIDNIFGTIRELGMNVATIYIGGGTPTILTPDQLAFLLSKIREHVTDVREFTVEAGRPDTITADKLTTLADYGVDRISVNPQSLNDDVLRSIGRAHDTEMFYRAYETAKASGIKNINVDLIAGLPNDTVDSFRNTVDRIVALDPENITVHTFSVKRSAELRSEGVFDRSGDIAAASVDYSQTVLPDAGYLPYYMYRQKNTVGNLENVGYAKLGHEGLYNVYMMEEVHSIFAAGASAMTKFVSLPTETGVRIERVAEPKYPYEYLRDHDGETGQHRRDLLKQSALEFFGK
ncbi:MAG: coproporphyrinogen dehydrogenase HemZ [Clostridia bacterium]|nr:coproporphyrinogen dehydrogenase HemZ [Clostridia bacterium]MBQ9996319.1 coproporphyrinogen dehydrogenase HemZ [Clostridia bacterium]